MKRLSPIPARYDRRHRHRDARLAGPNGAGRTTFAREFLQHVAGSPLFVNADLIAAGRENFERLYAPLVDAWALYDNAGPQPVLLDWSEKP